MIRAGRSSRDPRERAAGVVDEVAVSGVSRRGFLKGGAGGALLLVSGGLLTPVAARATQGIAPFFVYGTRGSHSAPGVSVAAAPGASAARTIAAVTGVASPPSADPSQSHLGAVSLDQTATSSSLTATVLRIATGAVADTSTVALPGVTDASSVIADVLMAPDGRTMAIVLAVSEHGPARTVTKPDPYGGPSRSIQTVSTTTHHELVYVDYRAGTVAGPMHLGDAPSLARSTAAATAENLFLATVPAAVAGAPRVTPSLQVLALGSGSAHARAAIPGPWPVNGDPVCPLPDGEVVRLVNASQLHVYTPADAATAIHSLAPLQVATAAQAAPGLARLADGALVAWNATIGRAVTVDPSASMRVVRECTFASPRYARAAGGSVAVAPDGTLYAVTADGRGVHAHAPTRRGRLTAAYSGGDELYGLRVLSDGHVAAFGRRSPQITVFSADLTPLATTTTDLVVGDIYG